jgi:hypothetical protein
VTANETVPASQSSFATIQPTISFQCAASIGRGTYHSAAQ